MDDLDYIDFEPGSTRISVRFVRYLDEEPEATADLVLNGDVSIEDVRRFVWPSDQEFPYYSDIKGRVDETNWGASSGFAEWLVQVSTEMPLDVLVGVMSAYIYEGAKNRRVRPMPGNEPSATERACQTVLVRNVELRREDLEVLSYIEDRDNGTETVVIAGGNWTYIVTIRALPLNHSLVHYSRTKRD